ncbi:MAG: hypothetical protein II288_00380 [Alistipes sp.]|nr:hypothetical protein [Alistipes sp.]
MKLRNLLSLMLVLSLLVAACKPATDPTPQPTPDPTPDPVPDPDPTPEYVCDIDFSYAYRVSSAEVGLPNNYFLIAFLDDTEQYLLGVVLVGAEGEEVLAEGVYTADDETLLLSGCELYTPIDEYGFENGDGTVNVSLATDAEGVYTFDILITDVNGNAFHFDYEGVVDDMIIENVLPTEPVHFDAEFFNGTYYAQKYSETYNTNIYFSDKGFDAEGYAVGGGTYYLVDFYTTEPPVVDAEGYLIVPEGEYLFDADSTTAANTISKEYSGYFVTNATATAYIAESQFDDARLVVTADSATLYVVIAGVEHTVVYNGAPKFYVGVSDNGEDGDTFVASKAYAYYYGDMYAPGVSDNFYFFLSDLGVDEDGWDYAGATYYRFDLYAPITEDATITPGTYKLDPNDTCAVWTMGAGYSAYYKFNEFGDDYDFVEYFTDGYITFNEDGSIVAEVTTYSGAVISATYPAGGDIVIYDATEEGGGDYEGPFSTLTEDYTCVLNDHTLYYMSYGDYYEVGLQNWMFMIAPANGEGDFVQFDVLAGPDSTSFVGEYTISNTLDSYTSYPGNIWGDDLSGSWYYTNDGVTMAPFIDGTLNIVENTDGTMSVSFDVYDDVDNRINGTWTGEAVDYEQLSTRGGSLKHMRSVVIEDAVAPVMSKERIEAKPVQQKEAVKGLMLR